MQALISSLEPSFGGYRVAQVVADGATFPVAEGLSWVACDTTVVADVAYYDPVKAVIVVPPAPVNPAIPKVV